MLEEKSILKLCKRATKRKPKSVLIVDIAGSKQRFLKTNRGVFRCTENSAGWKVENVSFVTSGLSTSEH